MQENPWLIGGLMVIMGLVLFLPFSSKKVEEELEIFLLIMGVVTVSVSGLWSWHLLWESIHEPLKISAAVLLAGLVFRLLRTRIKPFIHSAVHRIGYGPFLFGMVVLLGLLSSIITAIIAAMVIIEIVGALKLSRDSQVKVVILACYAIGFGAVLTPLGEPLATIAIAKLQDEPYYADFFFLFRMLGKWVIPVVLGLGLFAAFRIRPGKLEVGYTQDSPEPIRGVLIRALKVYLFVMALIFLGAGLSPVVELYLVKAPVLLLYWINILSAVLDNATITAAEISPQMPLKTIEVLLLGLLAAGGMLIPGNIPNIICANKLSIKSKEWAAFGFPVGIVVMTGIFMLILLFE